MYNKKVIRSWIWNKYNNN